MKASKTQSTFEKKIKTLGFKKKSSSDGLVMFELTPAKLEQPKGRK